LGFTDMRQITARLPDEVVESIDRAARRLHRTRADIVRQAIERYLEDFDDLAVAIERLQDPVDPVLDWDDVKRELLAKD
jgi:predicted DNA-binding protein